MGRAISSESGWRFGEKQYLLRVHVLCVKSKGQQCSDLGYEGEGCGTIPLLRKSMSAKDTLEASGDKAADVLQISLVLSRT